MFMQIASLLWAFEITPGKDANGNIVLPDPMDGIDDGLVVYVTDSSSFDS